MAELTPKTIAELPDDTSLSGSELFPVMDGSTSKKVPLSALRNQFWMLATGTVLEADSNLDELLSPATYICYSARSFGGDRPTQNSFKLFVSRFYIDGGISYTLQIAYELGVRCKEHRRYYGSNGWTSWISLDIGALNTAVAALGDGNISMTPINVSTAAEGVDLPVTTGKHGLLFFASRSASSNGLYSITCVSDGTVYVNTLVEGTRLVLTAGTNTVNIKFNADSYYAYGLYIEY